jgi:hypothetical protein
VTDAARDWRRPATWGVCSALAILAALVVIPAYVNHDSAWYVLMADALLRGQTLYRDIVDTNPPLIVWATVPPVLAARLLGVAATAAFKGYVLLLIALSAAWSARLLRRWTSGDGAGLLTCAVVFALLPFVKGDFGQREHFAVLLTLPYVLLVAASAAGLRSGKWTALATGVAGGLGFAFKPHLALGLVGTELAYWVSVRRVDWRRPELLGAVVAGVAYGACILAFTPAYLPLADAAWRVYGGLNSSPAAMLRMPDLPIWGAALMAVLMVRLPDRQHRPAVVLFGALTGFLLAGLLQFKGWSYHMYPARVFEVLFVVAFVAALFDGVPELSAVIRGGARGVSGLIAAALLLSAGRYVVESRHPAAPDMVSPLVSLLRQQVDRSVAVLSMRTIVYPAFPAVNYADARWVLRHNSLWFLPGFYEDAPMRPDGAVAPRSPGQMPELERRFYEEIVSDLCAQPPGVLLIETSMPRAPASRRVLDLAAYYGQDSRFARMFAAYDPVSSVGPFTVFSRVKPASCGGEVLARTGVAPVADADRR